MKCWLSQTKWVLLTVVVVGLLLRILIAIHGGLNTPPRPSSDQSEYDSYAWNLAQGKGYAGISPDVVDENGNLLVHPTAYRAPGPSLLWGGLYAIFGHSYAAVRIVHCILGSLTILLIYNIGLRCFNAHVAMGAATIYSLWPTALFYSSDLVSEPLFTLLLSWHLLALLQFAEDPRWSKCILPSLLLGLSMLTRPNAVFMVPLTVIWGLVQFRKRTNYITLALAVPMLSLVTLGPWALRNYLAFSRFIPFSTGAGDVLLGGNNRIVVTDPKWAGFWVYPTTELSEYTRAIKSPNNEVERDQIERQLAFRWLKENPKYWGRLLWSKFHRGWTPFLQPTSPQLYRLGMLITWGPILILFCIAILPTLIHFLCVGHPGWILHLAVLHFQLTALVFWGSNRFRFPIEGVCIILACAAIFYLHQLCPGKRSTPIPT